jgi:protein-L-isoaspartate(D-aspartate) O-methyltransferase
VDRQGIGMTSQRARDRMVQRLQEQGIKDMRVLAAMRQVPRHLFIEEALASRAYEDTALPIDAGQTISQPYIVARMTELVLQVPDVKKVLEVGTGSGYQAAVLAELVERVYSVERIQRLYKQAHEKLWKLGYRNIRLRHSDGSWGWEEAAPFDVIIVTAAPEVLPDALLEQVRIGGRIIVPVGGSGNVQELQCLTRTESGFDKEVIERVVFVPMLQGEVP